MGNIWTISCIRGTELEGDGVQPTRFIQSMVDNVEHLMAVVCFKRDASTSRREHWLMLALLRRKHLQLDKFQFIF